MRQRGRGRPQKIDPNRRLISIDQAVQLTTEYWAAFGKKGYAKGSIYNLISAGKLHKQETGKGVLLFEDEIKEKLCG